MTVERIQVIKSRILLIHFFFFSNGMLLAISTNVLFLECTIFRKPLVFAFESSQYLARKLLNQQPSMCPSPI